MGEMRASTKPNKLYIIRKVLMRAIQRSTFYWVPKNQSLWKHVTKKYEKFSGKISYPKIWLDFRLKNVARTSPYKK